MSNDEKQTPQQMSGDDWQVLTAEECQEEMASRMADELAREKGEPEKVGRVMERFLQSYAAHKSETEDANRIVVPEKLTQWLAAEFQQYPAIWKDDEEREATAREVVDNVSLANQKKASLQAHLDQGKSQASWLATGIEKSATASGAANVGSYATGIDRAIGEANLKNWEAVLRKDGFVSQNPNLDGFIAEHHHANTFNIDVATKEGSVKAVVLGSNEKNSPDLVIVDDSGKVIPGTGGQCKYYEDAESTQNALFDESTGKRRYPDQQEIVPTEQAKDIPGSSDVYKHDKFRSKPNSKEDVKEQQEMAQKEGEVKQYDWNDVSRIDYAKQIGKKALVGAYITAGFQGVRILSRRLWNNLNGRENPTVNEDLQAFFEDSVKSSAHVGVQVAVSGAVVVAVKNGWLGTVLKYTPAGRIANIVHIGLENAKVLFKLNSGEISPDEALDAMGRTTVSAAAAIAGAVEGATLGAALGTVLGPVGIFLGGLVGGMAGGIAGSKIGEAVYEGGKAVVKAAGNVLRSVANGIGSGFNAIRNGLRSVFA